MSLWKKKLGVSKKANGPEQGRRENQIIEEPEHDLANRSPDDLMVVKDKSSGEDREGKLDYKQAESNSSDDKKDLGNKDSP